MSATLMRLPVPTAKPPMPANRFGEILKLVMFLIRKQEMIQRLEQVGIIIVILGFVVGMVVQTVMRIPKITLVK